MSQEVYQRMRYVNVKLQEYVEQIFFYSKLNCEHKDYIFRPVFLQECVEHAIEDYRYFLEEKQIHITIYYSKLNCEHKDYIFRPVFLQECVEHAIEDYRYFLEEKQIHITMDLGNAQVLTDQKSLEFILAQLLANAITYLPVMQEEKEISFVVQHREKEVILLVKDNGIGSLEFILAQLLANAITYLPVMQEEKEISFVVQHREKEVILLVKDNGIGVKPSDLPFVFEKGFSGDNQEVNKKTTGMGLYLVRELAKSLNFDCQAQSEYGKGFGVELRFPVV